MSHLKKLKEFIDSLTPEEFIKRMHEKWEADYKQQKDMWVIEKLEEDEGEENGTKRSK